jgi:hypothetical protein
MTVPVDWQYSMVDASAVMGAGRVALQRYRGVSRGTSVRAWAPMTWGLPRKPARMWQIERETVPRRSSTSCHYSAYLLRAVGSRSGRSTTSYIFHCR